MQRFKINVNNNGKRGQKKNEKFIHDDYMELLLSAYWAMYTTEHIEWNTMMGMGPSMILMK